MLSQLSSPIQALILDMDGVLYRSNESIGDLPAIFRRINELGLKVMYATNNTVRTPAQYVSRMAGFGVKAEEWQFITAPLATAHALAQRWPEGGPIHMMGEIGLRKVLEDKGFYHADDNVLAVVSGLDKNFTYDMFVKGIRLIVKGAPFHRHKSGPDLPHPRWPSHRHRRPARHPGSLLGCQARDHWQALPRHDGNGPRTPRHAAGTGPGCRRPPQHRHRRRSGCGM